MRQVMKAVDGLRGQVEELTERVEALEAVHRYLSELLADGIIERVTHGTVHLPSSARYCLTTQGIREAAGVLGFDSIIRNVTGVIALLITIINVLVPGALPTPFAYEGWRDS